MLMANSKVISAMSSTITEDRAVNGLHDQNLKTQKTILGFGLTE